MFYIILLLISTNWVYALNYDNFCKDWETIQYISKNIWFENIEYTPENLINLKEAKELAIKNNIDVYYNVSDVIFLKLEISKAIDKMWEDFFKEFNKNLEITEWYISPSINNQREKDWCISNICDWAWFTDNQTWLSIILFSPLVKDEFLKNEEYTKYYLWLKENSYKYWFINLYNAWIFIDWKEEVPWYYRYVWIELSEILHNSNMSFWEFIKENKENISCYKEMEIIENNNETNTQKSWWFDPIEWIYPWRFYDYSIFDKEFLDMLRVNLVVSDSFLDLENNLKNQNMPSFMEIYYDSIEYINNNKRLNSSEKENYIKKLENPIVKEFISDILPAIILIEHNWNTKMNPSNWQWIFQLYAMQFYSTWQWKCEWNPDYIYFSECSNLANLYKPSKELTKEDQIEQLINISMFIENKYRYFESKLYDADNEWYSYNYNLQYIIEGINDELKLNKEEIEQLKKDIMIKNSSSLTEFINKKWSVLQLYWIETPEDLYMWLNYIRIWWIGTLYNWLWNNWYRMFKSYWDLKFVIDNNYVSNAPAFWNCFWTLSYDGGWAKNIKKTNGIMMSYLQYNYQDYDIKQVEFSTLIKKLAENGKLYAYFGDCK